MRLAQRNRLLDHLAESADVLKRHCAQIDYRQTQALCYASTATSVPVYAVPWPPIPRCADNGGMVAERARRIDRQFLGLLR